VRGGERLGPVPPLVECPLDAVLLVTVEEGGEVPCGLEQLGVVEDLVRARHFGSTD
jgi:hypothetical protein